MGRIFVLWFLIISQSLLPAFGNLSEKDSNTSSDIYVRKKRIIDNSPDSDAKVLYQLVPYVVALLNPDNGDVRCTGIILAPRVVLTAAHCIYRINVTVMSEVPTTHRKRLHTTASTIFHDHYDPRSTIINDLGLVIIREPIDIFHSFHRAISIYNGTLPPNSMGLVSGFGDYSRTRAGCPSCVRSILVLILSHQRCHSLMHQHVPVTEKHICTYFHNREKCCWYGDSGGPLVYNGYLIGVFSTFDNSGNLHLADVFMNLLDPEYKLWIETSVNFINSVHVHHHY